jgi:hypothetical protein
VSFSKKELQLCAQHAWGWTYHWLPFLSEKSIIFRLEGAISHEKNLQGFVWQRLQTLQFLIVQGSKEMQIFLLGGLTFSGSTK